MFQSMVLRQWWWLCPVALLVLCDCVLSQIGILCNYCFNADRVEDCMRSTKRCPLGDVCFIDESTITYERGDGDKKNVRTSYMFKMGCQFYGMCKDGVSYGPGPQGYSNIIRSCCCTDRCLKSDGVGNGNYDQCSQPVVNITYTSQSPSIHHQMTPLLILTNAWTLYLN